MTIIPLAIIFCSGGTVTTSLCTCVWFLWRTTLYYIAQIFEHRKQYNSTAIIAEDNHGNAGAQSQLVKAFISVCGNNDTHVRDYANPIGFLRGLTVCPRAPCHLQQHVGKISAAFLRPTRHRVVSAIYGALSIYNWQFYDLRPTDYL